jgi:hypothetical protein
MPEPPVILKFPEPEADEVSDLVLGLRQMAERATSPVVRACLREAAADIAHLTATGGGHEDAEGCQATG